MNIKEEIEKLLEESGWSASRLAAEAGVPVPCVTRLLSGERRGLHSSTLTKLWPFIYGDKRPKAGPEHDQAA